MTTAIYLRVSTHHQDSAHQRVAAENYVAANFPNTDTAVYEDFGISGAVSDRPALMRLIADVKLGRIARLVTFEWSRLSRDFMFGLNFMRTLTEYQVPLYVPNEELLKFDSAMDQFLMALKAFSAASERESISQRIKSGLAMAKAAGKRVGAAKGSKSNRGHRKVYSGDDVAKIIAMRKNGCSLSTIARLLDNKFSRSKIFNILKRHDTDDSEATVLEMLHNQ